MQTQPLDRDNQIAAADAAIALAFGNATLRPTFQLAAGCSAASPRPGVLTPLKAAAGAIEL
jgi:hypothetical protein